MKDEQFIANFMGLKHRLITGPLTGEDYVEVKHTNNSNWQIAHYKTSWDWIMPVVEKIEKLGYEVIISSQMETVDDDRNLIWHQDVNIGDGLIEITETHSESKIESTYMAIVEFIEWYNTQTPHP